MATKVIALSRRIVLSVGWAGSGMWSTREAVDMQGLDEHVRIVSLEWIRGSEKIGPRGLRLYVGALKLGITFAGKSYQRKRRKK